MTVYTGAGGELRYNGVRIAKCREYSLEVARDALETTGLGDHDRTYTQGIRGTSGSATILYDRDDNATRNLLNSIFEDDNNGQLVSFVLNANDGAVMESTAVITSVSTPVAVGDVIACSVSFQVSGRLSGEF